MSETAEGLFPDLPSGAENIHFKQAELRQDRTEKLRKLFSSWGYSWVKTPVFDYWDLYSSLMNRQDKASSYRFFDRAGELLLLRPDITLFLARQICLHSTIKDLPLRLDYADSIIHHEEKENFFNNELFQVGAELVGVPGLEGDSECILLLYGVMKKLRLKNYILCLGTQAFWNTLCFRRPRKWSQSLLHALEVHDVSAVGRILKEASFSSQEREVLEKLFFFIGKPAGFPAEWLKLLPSGFQEPVNYLLSLAAFVLKHEPDCPLLIDFSTIGKHQYYSGMILAAYMEGLDSHVAFGGRYDKLLGHFGLETTSVGFSLLLSKIESFRPASPRKRKKESFNKSLSFTDRYKKLGQ